MTDVLFLDLPKLQYFNGEVVKGSLVFTGKEDQQVIGAYLHINGIEIVNTFMGVRRRGLIKGCASLFGAKSEHSGNATLLSAGEHRWNFKFVLPKKAPPSCEHRQRRVKIQYELEAYLMKPNHIRKCVCTQMIQIGFPHLVNPKYKPQVVRKELNVELNPSKIFFNHGPDNNTIELQASVDKPITFAGDIVKLSLKVKNFSNKAVSWVQIKLKQAWLIDDEPEKANIWALRVKNSNFPLEKRIWSEEVRVLIPNTNFQPTVTTAHLSSLHYYFSIRAKVKHGMTVKVSVPITMASFRILTKEELDEYFKDSSTQGDQVQAKGGGQDKSKSVPACVEWDSSYDDSTLTPPLLPSQGGPEDLHQVQPPKPKLEDVDLSKFSIIDPILQGQAVNPVKLEYENLFACAKKQMAELDQIFQSCSAGRFHLMVDIFRSSDNFELVLHNVNGQIVKLCEMVNKNIQNLSVDSEMATPFFQHQSLLHAKKVTNAAGTLLESTKQLCATLSDVRFQLEFVQRMKTVFASVYQILAKCAELASLHPEKGDDKILFSSVGELNHFVKYLHIFLKHVCGTLTEQRKTIQHELFSIQTELETFQASQEPSEGDNASLAMWLDRIEKRCKDSVVTIHKMVTAFYTLEQIQLTEVALKLSSSCQDLLQVARDCPGPSQQVAFKGEQIVSAVREVVHLAIKLLHIFNQFVIQGNLHRPLNLESNMSQVAQVILHKLGSLITLCHQQPNSANSSITRDKQNAGLAALKEAIQVIQPTVAFLEESPHQEAILCIEMLESIRRLLQSVCDSRLSLQPELFGVSTKMQLLTNEFAQVVTSSRWNSHRVLHSLVLIARACNDFQDIAKSKGQPNEVDSSISSVLSNIAETSSKLLQFGAKTA